MQRQTRGGQDCLSTLSLFLFMFPLSLCWVVQCNKRGEKRQKCSLGKGVLWVGTCQEAPDVRGRGSQGKVPLPCEWGGPHTQTHTYDEHYQASRTHLHQSDPVNFVQCISTQLIIDYPEVKITFSILCNLRYSTVLTFEPWRPVAAYKLLVHLNEQLCGRNIVR